MTWVVVANTNNCRIYQYDKTHSQLSLLKEINHPELRQKTSENLTSDKPGHYHSSQTARGAFSSHTDPKEAEVDSFSRNIAEELDKARKDKLYDKLIVVTAPHMNGLLFQHLNKHVKELVVNNIQKDMQYLTEHDLINFLKSHAQFPDQH